MSDAIASQPETPTSAVAGWYPDPQGSGQNRWFDGTQWTGAYQPAQAAQQAPQKQAKDRAVYTRQQKGHSLTLFILVDWITLYIRTIYYSVSPNHYWHA
jgi:hypothetical protein